MWVLDNDNYKLMLSQPLLGPSSLLSIFLCKRRVRLHRLTTFDAFRVFPKFSFHWLRIHRLRKFSSRNAAVAPSPLLLPPHPCKRIFRRIFPLANTPPPFQRTQGLTGFHWITDWDPMLTNGILTPYRLSTTKRPPWPTGSSPLWIGTCRHNDR